MWLNVVLFLVAVFVALYWYLTRNFGFFLKHGVFEAPSSFPFGSGPAFKLFTGKQKRRHLIPQKQKNKGKILLFFLLGRASFSTFLDELYTDYSNHKMVGHYSLGRPGLVLNDLDLIKQVLIKDFDHFTDRRTFDMDETEYLNKIALSMLVNLKGDRWKMARSKISPAFTSGKLKQMMPLIHKVGDDLNEHLKELAERNEEFSAKSAMTNFTLDAIASCGFGVEANSFKDPNGIFPTMVKQSKN